MEPCFLPDEGAPPTFLADKLTANSLLISSLEVNLIECMQKHLITPTLGWILTGVFFSSVSSGIFASYELIV